MRPTCHLRDLATETIEISPAVTASAPAALFPEGALEKITGLSPWRSWPVEDPLIKGGAISHLATLAHIVEDTAIFGPMVYKEGAKYDVGFGEERIWQQITSPSTTLDEAALVSCYAGSRFFGPFLKDSLPQELLPQDTAKMISLRTKPYSHEDGYRTLFGLPAPPVIDVARVKRLTFYDDIGQNAGKAARLHSLRERLRQTLNAAGQDRPKGVYLKRGNTGEARTLVNEATLEKCLKDLGFDIVEPARLPADEIARRTLDAPIVISIEGSHISHAVYSMATTGTLLVVQPPDRFAMAFKEFTDQIGIRFAFFVGDAAPGGFSVNMDAFQRFLERATP
ncbi:MAG: glycosyltransferase family 61 protein [Pseudomonadota bacterium]